MTPNDFGIIRQADHNLFALLFPPLTDISEYEIEVIHPEYVAGSFINTSGVITANANYQYAITDISKYDYLLLPYSLADNNVTASSGLSPGSGSLLPRMLGNTQTDNILSGYIMCKRPNNYPYANLSMVIGDNRPIICFRRHRSDNVNPLGVIRPINPGILQPGSLQPQVEDPDAQEDLDVQDPEEEQEES